MKAFNLKGYLKNPSRKVVTRDGRNVTIYCTDYIDECIGSVIAKIEGDVFSNSFQKDGRYVDYEESNNDLFFAPEKHEGWISIYQGKDGPITGNVIFTSKEEAEESKSHCCGFTKGLYTTRVKIEWED